MRDMQNLETFHEMNFRTMRHRRFQDRRGWPTSLNPLQRGRRRAVLALMAILLTGPAWKGAIAPPPAVSVPTAGARVPAGGSSRSALVWHARVGWRH